jgi:rhodanese-related sulfurtransferase
VIFCQKGLRGYLAELILRNNGINDVLNVAGGYKLWKMYGDQIKSSDSIPLNFKTE